MRLIEIQCQRLLTLQGPAITNGMATGGMGSPFLPKDGPRDSFTTDEKTARQGRPEALVPKLRICWLTIFVRNARRRILIVLNFVTEFHTLI